MLTDCRQHDSQELYGISGDDERERESEIIYDVIFVEKPLALVHT